MNPTRDLRTTCILALALVALALKLALAYNTIGTNDATLSSTGNLAISFTNATSTINGPNGLTVTTNGATKSAWR